MPKSSHKRKKKTTKTYIEIKGGSHPRRKKKINYAKAAKKIRAFYSLPFKNRTNFTPTQKRIIARKWDTVRWKQNAHVSKNHTKKRCAARAPI